MLVAAKPWQGMLPRQVFVLAIAQANYLVTGNLKHFPTALSGTRTVTARHLLNIVSGGTDEEPASN